MILFLDSGPLGLLCSPPRRRGDAADCQNWLKRHFESMTRVVVPEIADYEIRRELIHRDLSNSIHRLDRLGNQLGYLQITTAALRYAAGLWGRARQLGLPTASSDSMDCDVVLAAQVLELDLEDCIIATSNAAHLGRFADARNWQEIEPV